MAEFTLPKNSKVSKDGHELSVRGHSEALNFLAFNLAYQIIRGVRDPADARRFASKIAQISQSGKSSSYMDRLLFLEPAGAIVPK